MAYDFLAAAQNAIDRLGINTGIGAAVNPDTVNIFSSTTGKKNKQEELNRMLADTQAKIASYNSQNLSNTDAPAVAPAVAPVVAPVVAEKRNSEGLTRSEFEDRIRKSVYATSAIKDPERFIREAVEGQFADNPFTVRESYGAYDPYKMERIYGK